jgi:hypothetical protein
MSVHVSLIPHGKVTLKASDRSSSGRVNIYSAGSYSMPGVL